MNRPTHHRGQSIVEISLITPLLLVALYVPADFGIAMFTAHLTQNAVREAARIGVSTKDPFDAAAADAVGDEALARLPTLLGSRTVTVNYYGPATATCMQSVQVTAQGAYNFSLYGLMRLLGFTAPSSLTINRGTRMWYEFQPVTNVTPICSTISLTRTRS
jgi:Flp pilus assembly protein TadG